METVGHRSLAFLELEYCEGGDLHGLILGAQAEQKAVPHTRVAAAAAGAAVMGEIRRGQRGRGAIHASSLPAARDDEQASIVPPGEEDAGGSAGMVVGGSGGGGDDGGSQTLGRRGSTVAAGGVVEVVAQARPGRSVGLSPAQIGRVALGLCEGLQRLHEVGGWVGWMAYRDSRTIVGAMCTWYLSCVLTNTSIEATYFQQVLAY